MATTKLFIKNMVCDRCKKVVKDELSGLGYKVLRIDLGEAIIDTVSATQQVNLIEIRQNLEENGFELLDDQKAKLIEKIKVAIIELVHTQGEADLHMNTSDFLSEKLDMDYHYISSLFSAYEGITIEKYLILQRIEKVKELIVYNELSLKEIAFKLGYSSVAHLSNQFKKVTGLTPSHFRELKEQKRKNIDKLL